MDQPTPPFLDEPPVSQTLTAYDLEHMALYLRLLDSARDGADWREAVQILSASIPLAIRCAAAMSMTRISRGHAG